MTMKIIATNALSPDRLFSHYRTVLLQLAARAVAHGYRPEQVVVMVADVDDPKWSGLVTDIAFSDGWHAQRKNGMRPVLVGSFEADIVPHLVEREPALAEGVWRRARHGLVRAIVLSDGRETVRHLNPRRSASVSVPS